MRQFELAPLGTALMLAVYVLLGALVSTSRLPQRAKWILYAALALRVVGAQGRLLVAADSIVYFEWGMLYAEYFSKFDLSPLYDPALWRYPTWLGTNVVAYPAGVFIALIGPSGFGVFLCYALLAMGGVWAYALAFRRAFPRATYVSYWAWLFLFPAIWFWPSSLGKEAIMMLGLGLGTLGYVGNGRRENWPLLALGVAIVFVIRPQVAAVFVLSVVLGHWLEFRDWRPFRVVQGAAILVVGFFVITFAIEEEAGGVSVSNLEEYVDENARKSGTGGSAVEAVEVGPAGIPVAAMNVLFRPFIWEAHNLNSLLSALELLFMWGLLWFRRRQFRAMLKVWRRHRVLRFALAFVVLYVIALGLNVFNLGIMARQRTLVFPLFFLLFEAGTMFTRRRSVGPRVVSRAAVPA